MTTRRYEVPLSPGVVYDVVLSKYDDYAEVHVNGELQAAYRFNDDPSNPEHRVECSRFFKAQRKNTIRVYGSNRPRSNPLGEHDPNPGHIMYALTGTSYKVDIRVGDNNSYRDWVEIVEDIFTFIDHRYP